MPVRRVTIPPSQRPPRRTSALQRLTSPQALLALTLVSAPGCHEKEVPLIDAGIGGAGGATVTSSTTGSGGQPVVPGKCGNGVAEAGEQCDGDDLFSNTCATVGQGFDVGELRCTKGCLFDTTACKRIERSCIDGADNDANGLADCEDPQCAAACGDPCAEAAVYALPDHSSAFGDNTGHASTIKSTCADPSGAGPGIVFGVTSTSAGVLEVMLESGVDLALSVRKTCSDGGSEIACVDRFLGPGTMQRLVVPASAGESFFVVVEGHGAADTGTFTISVASREITCGDGFRDGSEGCDDGNTTSGDGCSAACALEPTEVEPNDTTASANPHAGAWVGEIAPQGDIDVIAVNVPSAPAGLRATMLDFDGHSCGEGGLEGWIQILDADGVTVLTSRDAGASDTCPSALAGIATPGTYYVRVRASGLALAPTFPYRLDVAVTSSVCGNGVIEPLEQCDDGGLSSGDGCNASCQLEPTETEPNDAVAAADAYTSPWFASISPAGDVDVVSFDVPQGASQVTLHVGDNGDGDCAANAIVSGVELLAPDAVTVLGSSQGSQQDFCAFLLVANAGASTPIHAGKYFARVRAGKSLPAATFTYALAIDTQ